MLAITSSCILAIKAAHEHGLLPIKILLHVQRPISMYLAGVELASAICYFVLVRKSFLRDCLKARWTVGGTSKQSTKIFAKSYF